MARWGNNLANTELRVVYDPFTDVNAKVVKVSALQGQPQEDKAQSLGVAVKFEFLDGPHVGKKFDTIFWLHTEESERITKQNVMAIFGYPKDQEKEYNTVAADYDWFVDGDTKEVGSGWIYLEGRAVKVSADVKPNKQTGEQQNQFKFFPL